MKKIGILCLLALLGAVTPTTNPGVVFEIEVTDYQQGGAVYDTRISVEGRNLNMQIASGEQPDRNEMIYRGERREMVVVDHDRKSYLVMDEAAMKDIGGQVSAAMRQVEEALKNVPENQRAAIEKMMKERMPQQGPQRAPSEIRKTTERATHAGYPCVKYEVLREGRKVRELWVTDWDNVSGAEEARAVFEDMAAFYTDLMESLQNSMGGADGPFTAGYHPFDELDQLGGFPVLTREFGGDGELEAESVLKSARRQTLDPAAFEPPSGYKRQSMAPR